MPGSSLFFIGSGGVNSVNGQTGDVVLTTTEISEGTNLYYTEARVSANASVAANTAKVSADGSINTHSDVSAGSPSNNDLLAFNSISSNWETKSFVEYSRNNTFGVSIINNNSPGTNFITLSKAVSRSVMLHYTLYRKSDTDPEAVRTGILFCTWFEDADQWNISDVLRDFDAPDLIGVTFTINPATGQVGYTSTNYNASGYTSRIRVSYINDLPL